MGDNNHCRPINTKIEEEKHPLCGFPGNHFGKYDTSFISASTLSKILQLSEFETPPGV